MCRFSGLHSSKSRSYIGLQHTSNYFSLMLARASANSLPSFVRSIVQYMRSCALLPVCKPTDLFFSNHITHSLAAFINRKTIRLLKVIAVVVDVCK